MDKEVRAKLENEKEWRIVIYDEITGMRQDFNNFKLKSQEDLSKFKVKMIGFITVAVAICEGAIQVYTQINK